MIAGNVEETISRDGALHTALSEFARRLPVVHQRFERSDVLRQVLIVGARAAAAGSVGQPSLIVHSHAFIFVEAQNRKLHFFSNRRSLLRTGQKELESLCSRVECVQHSDQFGVWHDAPLPGHESWDANIGDWLAADLVRHYPEFEDSRDHVAEALLATALPLRDTFTSGLDQATLEASYQFGLETVRGFNVLAHPDPRIALYRRQAVSVLPLLGVLWAEQDSLPMTWIRDAVDGRLPLMTAMAQAYGVPRETIRFLRGKSPDALGLDIKTGTGCAWVRDTYSVLHALAAMAPEHRPRTLPEWSVFYELVDAFTRGDLLSDSVLQSFFHDAGKRGLRAARDSFVRKYGSLAVIRECGDLLAALKEALARAGRTTDPEVNVLLFTDQVGLRSGLQCAKRWRHAVAREAAKRLALHEEEHPAFVLPFTVPAEIDGFRFVFLDRYSALVEEGLRMSHCVSTLYADCAKGRRSAFSLRSVDGSPVATFDISIVPGPEGADVIVRQLLGRHNESAGDKCACAVAEFVTRAKASLQLCPKATEAWLERSQHEQLCPPDKVAEEVLDQAKLEALDAALEGVEGIEWLRELLETRPHYAG